MRTPVWELEAPAHLREGLQCSHVMVWFCRGVAAAGVLAAGWSFTVPPPIFIQSGPSSGQTQRIHLVPLALCRLTWNVKDTTCPAAGRVWASTEGEGMWLVIPKNPSPLKLPSLCRKESFQEAMGI